MKSQNPAWRQHYREKGPTEPGQNLRHNRLRAGSLSAAAATAVLRRRVPSGSNILQPRDVLPDIATIPSSQSSTRDFVFLLRWEPPGNVPNCGRMIARVALSDSEDDCACWRRDVAACCLLRIIRPKKKSAIELEGVQSRRDSRRGDLNYVGKLTSLPPSLRAESIAFSHQWWPNLGLFLPDLIASNRDSISLTILGPQAWMVIAQQKINPSMKSNPEQSAPNTAFGRSAVYILVTRIECFARWILPIAAANRNQMEKKTITLIQKKTESMAVELPVVAVSPNEGLGAASVS
ncbi:hypothetical protein B0H14DRAFT_2557443 [Mycena olivaceomarginata]|nr:hypothetical protein B0H14DRAFT_2557443 [Mycena olivaceomarginata]